MAKKLKKRKKHNPKSFKVIRRNFGWYKRRFGIMLDPLLPYQREFLKNNLYLRDIVDEDQPLLAIFKILEMEQQNKRSRKWWYNPYTDSISTYKEIIESSNYVDWNCAICNVDIKSNMNDFSTVNFLCKECNKTHNNRKIIDERILNSSKLFTRHCKRLLKKDQRKFLVYVNRNRFRD